jgi:hypothetical protein
MPGEMLPSSLRYVTVGMWLLINRGMSNHELLIAGSIGITILRCDAV